MLVRSIFFFMNFFSLIYQWMFVGIRSISFFFISKWFCIFSLIYEWMFVGNKANPFFHILKWSCIFSLIYEWTCQQFVWVFWPEKVSNKERKGCKKKTMRLIGCKKTQCALGVRYLLSRLWPQCSSSKKVMRPWGLETIKKSPR